MVNKPLIRPYFWGGGVALGGVARIPMNIHIYIIFIFTYTFSSLFGLDLSRSRFKFEAL